MITIRTLLLSFSIFLAGSLFAQEKKTGITVVTDPVGAEVQLNGKIRLAGIAPVNFTQNLEGKYKLVVSKEGFESYKSSLTLLHGVGQNYTVTLKPKTRFKALMRSFLIPGWGQYYGDQKLKGGLFFGLAAGTAINLLMADSDYRTKRDDYFDLEQEYENLTKFEEIEAFYPRLQEARKDAYDAESRKRIAIGLTAAAWTLNVLDILFHFPDYSSLTMKSLSLKTDINPDEGRLILTYTF